MNLANDRMTVELRQIVNSNIVLFDFEYNFYRKASKEQFQQKFINHYYRHEIGFETVGAFKHELKTRLNEIYPYYAELWKTMNYEYNPIHNVDYQDITDGNSCSTNQVGNTPMGLVSTIDNYMDNVGKTVNSGSTTTHKIGNMGVQTTQSMIKQERELIINIDKQIIEDCSDLFMLVY